MRNHFITDNKQLIKLVKIRMMPKLIRVASRLALLNRNVMTRTGTKKWPPMMFKENQASNKARTWGGVVLSASTKCQHFVFI
jgi:hypothetical protein